jgi:hypothetical protein
MLLELVVLSTEAPQFSAVRLTVSCDVQDAPALICRFILQFSIIYVGYKVNLRELQTTELKVKERLVLSGNECHFTGIKHVGV